MFPSSALITITPENVKNFKFFNVFRGNINWLIRLKFASCLREISRKGI